MKYNLVTIPEKINQDYFNLNQEEAENYFNWFLSIKEKRLKVLSEVLKENGIELDYSRHSLSELFNWFCMNVSYRRITKHEIQEHLEQFGTGIPYREKQMDNKTISLVFDISIYWGQCFININNSIEWFMFFDNRKIKDADHGQPCLTSSKAIMKCNPRAIIEVNTLKIIDQRHRDDAFNRLIDVWLKYLSPS